MSFILAISGTIIGIVLFPVVYWLVPATAFDGLVFYRGLLAAGIGFLVNWLTMAVLTRGPKLAVPGHGFMFTPFCVAISAACFNVCFLTVFPVTIDRSLTTFLLEELEHRESMSPQALERALIDEYILRRKAIERRVEEQLITGNVTLEQDVVRLSPQGKRFLQFSRLIRRMFQLPDRSVVPEATVAPDSTVPGRE